jgi:plastocyanin
MKKLLIVFLALAAVVGGVYFLRQSYQRAPSYEAPESAAPTGANSVSVSNQKVDNIIIVSSARLEVAGYIAVHEDKNGAPGPVIGNSALLTTGSYNDVSVTLKRATKVGESLYAMLHKDNGDGVYKFPGDDLPVTDDAGKVVLAKFTITAATAAAREITVSGTEFSFSPKDITVKAGERVRLTFKNTGEAPHNWKVEGLNIGTRTIGGGQTDTIEFTAPTTAGVFNYIAFCGVPGHREAGMVGKLIVE